MTTVKSYAKMGFGLGLGVAASQLLYLALGLALIVWGLSLLKEARNGRGNLTVAYIVMGLGVVLGLGLGAGLFFENLMNNI
jgi:hypothetical protein